MFIDLLKNFAIVTITFAVVLYGIHLYLQRDSIWLTFDAMGYWLVLLIGFFYGIASAAFWSVRGWYDYLNIFGTEVPSEITSSEYGYGSIELNEELDDYVITMGTKEGILVMKPRRILRIKNMFLVPWTRIRQVYLWPPMGLNECESAEDCRRLSNKLRAELKIGGSSERSIKLSIPWNYDFNRLLPAHIDLRMAWQWPFPF